MEIAIWVVGTAVLVTAIMTGVGALSFLFVKELGDQTIGWSNAAAAGLMLSGPQANIRGERLPEVEADDSGYLKIRPGKFGTR